MVQINREGSCVRLRSSRLVLLVRLIVDQTRPFPQNVALTYNDDVEHQLLDCYASRKSLGRFLVESAFIRLYCSLWHCAVRMLIDDVLGFPIPSRRAGTRLGTSPGQSEVDSPNTHGVLPVVLSFALRFHGSCLLQSTGLSPQ
jgi:hypothetical protein